MEYELLAMCDFDEALFRDVVEAYYGLVDDDYTPEEAIAILAKEM